MKGASILLVLVCAFVSGLGFGGSKSSAYLGALVFLVFALIFAGFACRM